MNGPAHYLHIGFILISLANLIVIALLLLVFILAVALRLPERQRLSTLEVVQPPPGTGGGEMTCVKFGIAGLWITFTTRERSKARVQVWSNAHSHAASFHAYGRTHRLPLLYTPFLSDAQKRRVQQGRSRSLVVPRQFYIALACHWLTVALPLDIDCALPVGVPRRCRHHQFLILQRGCQSERCLEL